MRVARNCRFPASIVVLLALYLAILGPLARHMSERSVVEKLGLIPRPEILKILFADCQELVGASILTQVLLHFGTLLDRSDSPRELVQAADYPAMSRAVHTALELDPYNMDGYYFGQSILAWDAGQVRLANELLEYGMRYRTWDWQLPFFAAFNHAYFLNDREAAAVLYMRAGELSGEAMFRRLAGRYLQETGETQLAIDYLRAMNNDAHNPSIRETFELRIAAFEGALAIEQARDRYLEERGRFPDRVEALVAAGYLTALPVDPYGGVYYLDGEHKVQSTSLFSFATNSGLK
jgi:tetratricopeptide (TPR) repeat protein